MRTCVCTQAPGPQDGAGGPGCPAASLGTQNIACSCRLKAPRLSHPTEGKWGTFGGRGLSSHPAAADTACQSPTSPPACPLPDTG